MLHDHCCQYGNKAVLFVMLSAQLLAQITGIAQVFAFRCMCNSQRFFTLSVFK